MEAHSKYLEFEKSLNLAEGDLNNFYNLFKSQTS